MSLWADMVGSPKDFKLVLRAVDGTRSLMTLVEAYEAVTSQVFCVGSCRSSAMIWLSLNSISAKDS